MKSILILALSLTAVSTFAAPKVKTPAQAVCDSLQDKLDEDCAHIMCDDDVAKGIYKDLNDCTSAGDYAEAAQAGCEGQPSLEDMAKKYNQEHQGSNLTCEE